MAAPSSATDKSKSALDERDKAAAKQAAKTAAAQLKVSEEDIKSRLQIAQMQVGASTQNMAAQMQVEREKIAQAALEMQKIGIPQEALEEWKAQQNVNLQTASLQLDKDRLAYEAGRDTNQLEEQKAEWRASNALAIQSQDFNERSFDQKLQLQREEDANKLGLDTATYVQNKLDQDRTFGNMLEQQGFTNNLALRDQAFKESSYAESMGWDKQKFMQQQQQQAEQFAATNGLDREKFAADKANQEFQQALASRQQGSAEQQFADTLKQRQSEFGQTQALATRAQGETEEEFRQRQALAERAQSSSEQQFGITSALDVAKTAATMGGPADWANFLDYSNRVQNIGGVPAFLQRLAGGQVTPTGVTGSAPGARTFEGMVGQLAGTQQPQGTPMGGDGGVAQMTPDEAGFQYYLSQHGSPAGGDPAQYQAAMRAQYNALPADQKQPLLAGGAANQAKQAQLAQQGGMGMPQQGAGGGQTLGAMPQGQRLGGGQATQGGSGGMVAQQEAGGGAQMLSTMQGTGGYPQQTPSQSSSQVAALTRANPPSQGGGYSDRDMQVLNTIDNIYKNPHQAEGWGSMSSDQKAFLAGGAAKQGYSQNTFEDQWKKSRVGQGNVSG